MSGFLDGAPMRPLSHNDLALEIEQLEREYHEKFLNDPMFHAKSTMVGNFLDQLESVHQAGDTLRTGFLIAALLERTNPHRAELVHAWERGMADAKLQALGIKPLVRNPYLQEGM